MKWKNRLANMIGEKSVALSRSYIEGDGCITMIIGEPEAPELLKMKRKEYFEKRDAHENSNL